MRRPVLQLAPMAGVSDAPMRVMSARMGAAVCTTEMVSAEGLVRGSVRTRQLLMCHPEEGPLVVQLYGGTAEVMAEAAVRVTEHGGFCGIDVNAGCPVPKVLNCGSGAALMRDPSRIERMVAAMAKRTPLPITVKTRIGPCPGEVTVFDVIRAVEQGGGAGLAVHGRFASAGHGGPVDAALLARAVAATRLPVLVNGGVNTAEDAVLLLRETGAAGVMIARGAIGNPWLFGAVGDALDGRDHAAPVPRSFAERVEALRSHLTVAVAHHQRIREVFPADAWPSQSPEALAACSFRLYLFNYFKGLPGASALRREMLRWATPSAILQGVEALRAHAGR